MTKFYRLPDGIEVKSSNDGEVTGAGVWVVHPAYGSIAVDRDKLTQVPPPLPPEPKNNTDWRARQAVFSRRDQWTETVGDRHWYANIGESKYFPCTWEDVLAYAGERGKLTLLVPYVADDAALVEQVAQAMRDANTSEAWGDGTAYVIPMGHFAKVAVDTILRAGREVSR